MKKIEIEIPEGKEAKWVNGVLTLVDEQLKVEFKFNAGDKVTFKGDKTPYPYPYTITDRFGEREPIYKLDDCENVGEDVLELYTPKDITERINTFEDACEWCEENGKSKLVKEYDTLYYDRPYTHEDPSNDILAYLKLRIITCALNEGWEPDFWNEDEYKYWPWMNTLTEDEYNLLDDDKQKERCCRVVGRSNNRADAGGLVYAYEGYAATDLNSGDGSRLAFKSGELATYATKQFKEIFADFYFG